MKPIEHRKRYQNLNRIRVGVQIFTVLFLIAVPVLNYAGVHWILGTLYSISIGELDIADPVMVVQTILLTREVYAPLLFAVLVPVVLALVFGRVFCSWMCPQNTISEWIDAVQKRLFKARWRKSHMRPIARNPHPALYWSIFATLILLLLVFAFPLMGYLSAPGILSSQIAQGILGMGIGLEIVLIVIILVIEGVLFRRYWCTYICPVGACLALFRTSATLRLHHDAQQCDCKHGAEPCHYVCPLHLSPRQSGVYPYCFNCGLCIMVCEKTGMSALSFRIGKNKVEAGGQVSTTQPPFAQAARVGSFR